jgi:hypothetical protein
LDDHQFSRARIMSEYVEFVVHSQERLRQLQRVVVELQRVKTTAAKGPPCEFQPLFDEEALSHFVRHTPDQWAQRLHDLGTRPVVLTPTDQAVGQRWDFDSMVHAIMDSEYELLGCEPSLGGRARLSFRALAYPYGGVGALVALVEAFGFTVAGIEDGTGPIAVKGPTK